MDPETFNYVRKTEFSTRRLEYEIEFVPFFFFFSFEIAHYACSVFLMPNVKYALFYIVKNYCLTQSLCKCTEKFKNRGVKGSR